jgi:DNA gyrase subunit A
MHLLRVSDLPFGKFRDKGTPIDNLSNYNSSEENVIYITSLADIKNDRILFGTKQAMFKVVEGAEFDVAKRTTAATKLADGDELICVEPVTGNENIVMQSDKDYFLRIPVTEIPDKKKAAVGVRGMKMALGETLTVVHILRDGENASIEFKGRELSLNRLHVGKRDARGTKRDK